MANEKKKKDIGDKTIVTTIESIGLPKNKKAYVIFLSGPLVGKLHLLEEGETVLGRGKNANISINDNRISRHHVKINLEGETAIIEDMGSTNGTFVNGQRIKTYALQDGDKIQISSSTIFKYALQDKIEKIFHDELYKMAIIDAVTGIYNKRFFSERIREEFSYFKRSGSPLSLLMIDIDFFKKVNDTHGHLAGDFILHQLTQLLAAMVRHEDILARYGGEEFVIILRETDTEGAKILAERMRKAVEEKVIHFEDNVINITISMGIATLKGDNFKSPSHLIEAADANLYKSKENGRNLVTA
ncbi:GGDEF domain-containing protein [bacterium]|nr:GGDEF domain-containing protein [bacterium]